MRNWEHKSQLEVEGSLCDRRLCCKSVFWGEIGEPSRKTEKLPETTDTQTKREK